MANHIYFRASTDGQDFMQQQNCVNNYLTQHRINPKTDIAKTVVEKVSGTVKHTERKLASLLATSKQGDTIYISELSRLGRNMSDLFNIVTEACERKITIVQCKDGSTIENESIGGKALLFALSLAAEIEVANTRQRTRMALEARKNLLVTDGAFISKSGKVCTKLGRPKGIPNPSAIAAAAQSRVDAKIKWRETSSAYKWTMARVAEGMPRKESVRLFNEQHRLNPEVYCTRTGKPLTEATLSIWISEANPLAV